MIGRAVPSRVRSAGISTSCRSKQTNAGAFNSRSGQRFGGLSPVA